MPSKRDKRQKPQRAPNQSLPRLIHPPQLTPDIQFRKTFRFKASAAKNGSFSDVDLFNMLVLASSTTNCWRLLTGIRIRKLEIWAPMLSDLVPVTVTAEFSGVSTTNVSSVGGPRRMHSDTSMGSNCPAHIVAKPDPGSLAAFWFNYLNVIATATPICSLVISINSIIDLTVDCVVSNNETVASVIVIAGATVGQVYLRALDSTGANVLVPTDYRTI